MDERSNIRCKRANHNFDNHSLPRDSYIASVLWIYTLAKNLVVFPFVDDGCGCWGYVDVFFYGYGYNGFVRYHYFV